MTFRDIDNYAKKYYGGATASAGCRHDLDSCAFAVVVMPCRLSHVEKEEEVAEPTRKQLVALMQMRFAPESIMAHERWIAYVAGVSGDLIDKDGLQRILEGDHPRILMEMETVGLVPNMRTYQFYWSPQVAIEAVGEFADEECESSIGYPPDWQVSSVAEQAQILKDVFSELDISCVQQVAENVALPDGFDGLAVIPKFSAIEDRSSDYCWPDFNVAFKRLLNLFLEMEVLFDREYVLNFSSPNAVILDNATERVLADLSEKTPGDCLVLPVQTGMRHRGRSPRRAQECFEQGEFGLDAFSVGCFLLTNVDRLRLDYLSIDCPGTRVRNPKDPDAPFAFAGQWRRLVGSYRFNLRNNASLESYGSASFIALPGGGDSAQTIFPKEGDGQLLEF